MNTQITKVKKEQGELFLNLYHLYLYDLSEYTSEDPKENGKFDLTNTYLYLEREELHPFLITYHDKIVGFILVCTPPFVPKGIDFTIQELFILKKYRGLGIASIAVEHVLEKVKGNIRVDQLKNNKTAVAFWKKYYNRHQILFSEEEERIEIDGIDGFHTLISQQFNNIHSRGLSNESEHSQLQS